MRKLIFLICFLGLFRSVQAQELKGKFMLTAKTAYSFALPEQSTRRIYYGSEIGYFLNHQLLLGINLDYLEYGERAYLIEVENSGARFRNIPANSHRWYSFGLFSKLFFDVRRFTPFVKMGFGFYVPQTIYYQSLPSAEGGHYVKADAYGKTCFGMNFGAGIQYRFWKGLCLQTEGLLTTLTDRNKESGLNRNFTYANLNAGLSIIF
ncbi:MAG: outer membrane beta-barrel protein [candidate division Zixibacteria bacterium]|nr:outer membrane beta-barrel protein [candidate division Zixibacteria bacterium]